MTINTQAIPTGKPPKGYCWTYYPGETWYRELGGTSILAAARYHFECDLDDPGSAELNACPRKTVHVIDERGTTYVFEFKARIVLAWESYFVREETLDEPEG